MTTPAELNDSLCSKKPLHIAHKYTNQSKDHHKTDSYYVPLSSSKSLSLSTVISLKPVMRCDDQEQSRKLNGHTVIQTFSGQLWHLTDPLTRQIYYTLSMRKSINFNVWTNLNPYHKHCITVSIISVISHTYNASLNQLTCDICIRI